MFVDKAVITIKAGDGGDGAVSFLRLKGVPCGGPDGGCGGKGGDVIFVADENINTLAEFFYRKKFIAEKGERGGSKNCTGRSGRGLIIKVPAGTVIKDFESGRVIADLVSSGDSVNVLEGGRGGKGNASFCTSTRKAPSFAQQGEKTEPRKVLLELKLIADVGLVGFPNAGKSSLLAAISNARPKIANYHFTTLTPNLGVVSHREESFVAADIPGLIERASQGQGLGHQFLRHIERTRMLIHVIDMSGIEGRDPCRDFEIINGELGSYSEDLANMPQIVAANKMDIPEAEENLRRFREKVRGVKVFPCSAATRQGLSPILDECIQMLKILPKPQPLRFEPFMFTEKRDDSFEVSKLEEGVFEVRGGLVDILAKNVTLDDYHSFNYFQRQLTDRGVIDKLREMGAKNGDTIIIGDTEFDFVE
jgi:GTP-binding protein